MRRLLFAFGAVAWFTGPVGAQYQPPPYPGNPYGQAGQAGPYDPYGQYGTQNNNNYMPNIYNPQTQPLSPYLNLLRGSNAGVNYYYGVRPGTVGAGGRGGGAPFVAMGGNRMSFFPQLATAPDPLSGSMSSGSVLAPAGHPVVFNNTLGFFPSAFGQAGGARPGLAGVGASQGAPGRR